MPERRRKRLQMKVINVIVNESQGGMSNREKDNYYVVIYGIRGGNKYLWNSKGL